MLSFHRPGPSRVWMGRDMISNRKSGPWTAHCAAVYIRIGFQWARAALGCCSGSVTEPTDVVCSYDEKTADISKQGWP